MFTLDGMGTDGNYKLCVQPPVSEFHILQIYVVYGQPFCLICILCGRHNIKSWHAYHLCQLILNY